MDVGLRLSLPNGHRSFDLFSLLPKIPSLPPGLPEACSKSTGRAACGLIPSGFGEQASCSDRGMLAVLVACHLGGGRG